MSAAQRCQGPTVIEMSHAYPVNAQKLGAATTGSVWRRVKLPPIVSLGVNRIGMKCPNLPNGVCNSFGAPLVLLERRNAFNESYNKR